MRLVLGAVSVVVFQACLMAGSFKVVCLDFSGTCNWDGYISQAERLEAVSYSPLEDWGLGDRMVRSVFGENYIGWSFNNNNYIWQEDAGNYTGLPMDGVIEADGWTYQLVTLLDAEPEGGWGNPEYPEGTNPRGLLPTVKNIIRIYRPHSGSTVHETATADILFEESQHGTYARLNLLMQGDNRREASIYAIYADGEELLWTGRPPTPAATLDPETYESDADLAEGFLGDYHYYNAGSPAYQHRKTGRVVMWHFADGLELNPKRILKGVRVTMTPVTYAGGDIAVYAVSGEPGFDGTTLIMLR